MRSHDRRQARSSARDPARSTRHALALAKREANSSSWFTGKAFEFTSRDPRLQRLVGHRGTLWIVVSERVAGRARYTVRFRYECCRKYTYRRNVGFGKYSVIGDPVKSRVFAPRDAAHLLLALRFVPKKPIDHPRDRLKVIGPSLQVVRELDAADVRLLEAFSAELTRWSVFISYQHEDRAKAMSLGRELERRGIPTFRDSASLAPGDAWWPAIADAIRRSRLLLVVVGKATASSSFVRREIAVARKAKVPVVPVIVAGGTLQDVKALKLQELHAVRYVARARSDALEHLVSRAYRRPTHGGPP